MMRNSLMSVVIALHLSLIAITHAQTSTIPTTTNNHDPTEPPNDRLSKKLEDVCTIVVYVLVGVSLLCVAVGYVASNYVYGDKSDPPNHGAIFKFGVGIADLLTDIVFCVKLWTADDDLAVACTIFIALPYVISNFLGVVIVEKCKDC